MNKHLSTQTNPSRESSEPPGIIESKTSDALAKANSEMEAVFQECMKLENQGKLEAATTARIEARLQEISNTLDKDLADQISLINANHSPSRRWMLPTSLRVPYLAFMGLLVGGALLEVTVGTGFIFSGGTGYRAAMPWLFGVLMPIFAAGWFFLEKTNHFLRTRYPTWLVRWLIVFPLTVALSAGMVVVSPLGWAALLGWAIGSPARVEVRVISVDTPTQSSRGCKQHAHLEFDGTTARICIKGRIIGPAPQAGERVAVSGLVSPMGLLINQIDHQN